VKDETEAQIAAAQKNTAAGEKQFALARVKSPMQILPPNDGIRYDDLCNAEHFLAAVGEDLLYAAEPKKWLIWSGTHWQTDSTNLVFELAAEFAKNLYAPENCRDEISYKHAKRTNMRAGLNAMIDIAQRKRAVQIETFDTRPELLNCLNGTLNLKTGITAATGQHAS
jgi:putative DNA primase/helicase